MSFFRCVVAAALFGPAALFGISEAQDGPRVEWEKRVDAEERLRSYGPEIMGDAIDPHTGTIVFEQTDISLPGNSKLEVSIRRRRAQGQLYGENVNAEFGDWEHLVPRIVVIAPSAQWQSARCSGPLNGSLGWVTSGTDLTTGGRPRVVLNWQYSQGVTLEVPGAAAQQIIDPVAGTAFPAAAKKVTADGWYFTCITLADGKEGFIGVARTGTNTGSIDITP